MIENRIKTTWLGVPTTCVDGIFGECGHALVDWLPTAEELDVIGRECLRLSILDSWWSATADHAEGGDGWETVGVYADTNGCMRVEARVNVGSERTSSSLQALRRGGNLGLAIRMTLRHARAMAAEWDAQGVGDER